ncbi:MAG: S8 family serine peptidase [Candidatus Thermoplasmatota archaeon]|nr:S8 family serine peptidase [Candidatus Thermoplasmatota archaeon]
MINSKSVKIGALIIVMIFLLSSFGALGNSIKNNPGTKQILSGAYGSRNTYRNYESTIITDHYVRPARSVDAIDEYLKDKMTELVSDEKLDIIVQFADTLGHYDRLSLEKAGVDILHTFHGLDIFHCKATSEQIRTINSNQRIFYIEYNEALVYDMDLSLETIKATDAMYSIVQSKDGAFQGQIDGTGVTAVVLDSGIDAGHPDLDYKEKTIMNLKSDADMVWIEVENSDTSSGHGTHCAGTVAGNGDASGGARRGVAPGAKLIGLSTGEAFFILNAVGALEWVYQHSKPHNNPYNIRVVSNSWGAGGGTYSPNDSISMAINKITYENNVVCVFAAGNSGGTGEDIRSSNYGNTPAAVCVAAAERDGSGIASFSSRGMDGMNSTYPDIAAPGVRIWSTAARRTLISAMTKQNAEVIDPYYFAISGTSMATPHISGVIALLWQACPSMRISDARDHYGGDDPEWSTRDDTRMHESELIMKASADYLQRSEENGIPDNWSVGYFGNNFDFAQGYGLVNVRKAVALAITLEELRTRDFDGDGVVDYPDATVFDAQKQYLQVIKNKTIFYPTTQLSAGWRGEWTRFTNQTNNQKTLETDQSHFIYVPENANKMVIDLTYSTISVPEFSAVSLALIIDANVDGNIDWRQNLASGRLSGRKHSELTLDSGELAKHRGRQWMFNIEGQGIDLTLLNLFQGTSYSEIKVEYDAGLVIHLEELPKNGNAIPLPSTQSSFSPLEPVQIGSPQTTEGLSMDRLVFDMSEVVGLDDMNVVEDEGGDMFYLLLWLGVIGLLLIAAITAYLVRKRKLSSKGLHEK